MSIGRFSRGVGVKLTYLNNGLDNLLNLARLHQTLGFRAEVGQFRLVALDPPLEVGDVVAVEPLPPVKQVAHADEGIPLPLQILEHALVPRPSLVFHKALALAEVLAHGYEAVVEQGNIVVVRGVRVGARLRQGLQREGDAGVVRCHTFAPLHEAVHDVAYVDVELSRPPDAIPRALEQPFKLGREGIFKTGWQRAAGEFVLDRDSSLLTPDGKLLAGTR